MDVIQLAKKVLGSDNKQDIYPKTIDSAVITTDAEGNSTTLDKVIVKNIKIGDTNYPVADSTITIPKISESNTGLDVLIDTTFNGLGENASSTDGKKTPPIFLTSEAIDRGEAILYPNIVDEGETSVKNLATLADAFFSGSVIKADINCSTPDGRNRKALEVPFLLVPTSPNIKVSTITVESNDRMGYSIFNGIAAAPNSNNGLDYLSIQVSIIVNHTNNEVISIDDINEVVDYFNDRQESVKQKLCEDWLKSNVVLVVKYEKVNFEALISSLTTTEN